MKSLRDERILAFVERLQLAVVDSAVLTYREAVLRSLDVCTYSSCSNDVNDAFTRLLCEDSLLEKLAYVKDPEEDAK